jgi:uncharacterized SAM-binding protein YcdF (DUF218 family)
LKRFLVRAAVILAALLILATLTLPRLGDWLVIQDPLEKADAIIVLGGTMYERPLEAMDLHREGWAPRILLFQQVVDWGEAELIQRKFPYMREVDLQIDVLTRLGVPPDAIVVLDQANSTADEARMVFEEVQRRKYARVIIVTSKQHTRRARLVMRRMLAPAGASPIVRYSRYDRSDTERWWAHRSTLRFTLFEVQRLFGYWLGVAD